MPPKKNDKSAASKEYVGPVEPTELEIQLQQELVYFHQNIFFSNNNRYINK